MKTALGVVLFAVPLVVGWLVARVVSLDTWGYAEEPPKLQLGEARLAAFSFVRFGGSGAEPTPLDRATMLAAMSRERCTRQEPSDCTLGRTLWTYLGNGAAASALPEALNSLEAISSAEKTGRFFTGSGGRCGTAIVAELELAGAESAKMVGFQSCELFDDRHRYSEVLLVDGDARQAVAYSFDVAGIEFATPTVLKAASLGAFGVTFGCGLLAAWLLGSGGLLRRRGGRSTPLDPLGAG